MKRYDDWFASMRHEMAGRYGEPVDALLLVHKGPERPVGRMLGRLRTNNLLTLTPSAVRINALAGRSGLKPGKDVAAWPLDVVHLSVTDTEKAAWFNTTMSWMEWQVHRLRLAGPDLVVVVDVLRESPVADPLPDLLRLYEVCGPRTQEAP